MASNEGDRVNVSQEVSYIVTIIIDSDTYPFTVLLNLLMIMAVKTGPQLHLGGLFSSDWHINWSSWPVIIHPVEDIPIVRSQYQWNSWKFAFQFHVSTLDASCLHPMWVTFERFIAIKCTSHKQTVSHRKITIALIAVWIITFVCRMFEALEMYLIFYSEGILVNPFRCVSICDFTSWNGSTSKEDKSTKTAPRGGGKIYQRRRGDYAFFKFDCVSSF